MSGLTADAAFTVAGFLATRLDQTQLPALQSLFERCTDYFEMAEGRPPGPDAASSELQDRPPGIPPEDAFCIGLKNGDGVTGVIQAFRHYRLRDEWYIGLMLMDPAARNKGLGAAFYQKFESWAAHQNAGKIQLSVLDCNPNAAKFWERLGFRFPRCYPEIAIGLRHHIIIEYEKPVAPHASTASDPAGGQHGKIT